MDGRQRGEEWRVKAGRSKEKDKAVKGNRQGGARRQTRRSREIDKAEQGDRQGGARKRQGGARR